MERGGGNGIWVHWQREGTAWKATASWPGQWRAGGGRPTAGACWVLEGDADAVVRSRPAGHQVGAAVFGVSMLTGFAWLYGGIGGHTATLVVPAVVLAAVGAVVWAGRCWRGRRVLRQLVDAAGPPPQGEGIAEGGWASSR